MIALGGDRPDRRKAFGSTVAVTVSSALATITYQSQWGGPRPGALDQPHGVATDPSGNVYVADRSTDEIQVFDSDGDSVTEWGGTGTATGKFDTPDSVAVDASGANVYVADFGNSRIQKFDPTGAFLDEFGSNGSAEGQFSGLLPGGTGSGRRPGR